MCRASRLWVMLWIAGLALGGCATAPNPVADISDDNTAAPSGVILSKPRRVELEFTTTIGPVTPLAGEALREVNRDKGVSENQPPTLLIWSAGPPELAAQNQIEWIEVSPEPADRFTDEENFNPILYWDLSDRLTSGSVIEIKRRFAYTSHEWTPLEVLNPTMTETHPRLMSLYTREEPFLQLTDEMRETAQRAIGDAQDQLSQARRLFDFVRGHMEYVYPPDERHALHALHSGKGDCGQYSYLFIALCRSIKIPARQQSGFVVKPDSLGYHVWSEIFIPPYGWIPVDATKENGFGRLNNDQLVASVGTHIPLRYVPAWATMNNSDAEAGRTDFMQFMTTVKSGFDGPVKSTRRVVKVEDLE